MFPDGLQNSERPTETLTHEAVGMGGRLGKSQREIFILHAVATLKQRHGEVRIFRDRILMVAANLADSGDAPCADRSRNHANGTKQVESAPFKILTGDVFEGLPACPKIHAVADFSIAGNC